MLVEILLVIVIIGLIVGGYYGLSGGGDGEEKSIPAQSIDRAKMVECANNLNQLRQLIQIHTMESEDGSYPKEFDPGAQGGIGHCPVSGRAYVYAPQTGTIKCTTPGHESL
jgi:hypothetical protein